MISSNRAPNETHLGYAELEHEKVRAFCSGDQWSDVIVSRNQSERPLEFHMLPIRAQIRQQDQQRIADLHQQADSEDWRGQVFARIETEEGDD